MTEKLNLSLDEASSIVRNVRNAAIRDVATIIEDKAEKHANDRGYGVAGTLTFGRQEEMDHYTTLTELADEVRAMQGANHD